MVFNFNAISPAVLLTLHRTANRMKVNCTLYSVHLFKKCPNVTNINENYYPVLNYEETKTSCLKQLIFKTVYK